MFEFANDGVMKCPIYYLDHTYAGGKLTEISNFTNVNFGTVRSTVINGKPYFCANDICECLDIDRSSISKIIKSAVDDISTYILKSGVYSPNAIDELYYYADVDITHPGNGNVMITQTVKMAYVSEHVMYSFVLRSRKPEASDFRGWLLYEVIPKLSILGRTNSNLILSQMIGVLNDIKNNLDQVKTNVNKDLYTDILIKGSIFAVADQIKGMNPVLAQLVASTNNILDNQNVINSNVLCGDGINIDTNINNSKKLDDIIKGLVTLFE